MLNNFICQNHKLPENYTYFLRSKVSASRSKKFKKIQNFLRICTHVVNSNCFSCTSTLTFSPKNGVNISKLAPISNQRFLSQCLDSSKQNLESSSWTVIKVSSEFIRIHHIVKGFTTVLYDFLWKKWWNHRASE